MKLIRSRRPRCPIVMYSRTNCGLCKDAETILLKAFGRKHLQIVDIMTNPRLEDLYVFRIPVVEVCGRVIAEGVIGSDDVRAIDAATRHSIDPTLR